MNREKAVIIFNILNRKQSFDLEIPLSISANDLVLAFQKFLERKELEKPLNTKVTTKEYSVKVRCDEIRNVLKKKKTTTFNY